MIKFKLGELFSGPGGIALGAHLADVKGVSIESVWANDFDPSTCETYKRNICQLSQVDVICEDVRELDIGRLKRIDCLAFGFPCNDFSIVGEQKGIDGDFGPLYTYGVMVIKKQKPKWFLAENVGGLKSANQGESFYRILNALFDEDYDLVPHLYKFEKYGVPQARHRIIIIGIRKDQGVTFHVPAPTHDKPVTSKEALCNPPIPTDAFNHEFTRQSKRVVERLKHIKHGQNAFNADIPKELQLNVKGAKISQIYKRLDPNKPSYTVTGSGGGGTHVYHWIENRALTNRERARLQSFPDYFEFVGGKEKVRKQIGMAVPPIGAKVIFEAVLKTFAGECYESVKPSFPPMFHSQKREIDFLNTYNEQARLLENEINYRA